MTNITIVGLDPSLSNWGMVKGTLNVNTDAIDIKDTHLIETKPTKLMNVRRNSDDLSRARNIYTKTEMFLKNVDIVFAELPVGSQSSRSMTSYGICVGLLATLNIPLIQIMPYEVKLAACGSRTATKAAIIQWAVDKYPNLQWFTKVMPEGIGYTGKNEHIADAIGTIYAGIETDQYKQAKALFKRNL